MRFVLSTPGDSFWQLGRDCFKKGRALRLIGVVLAFSVLVFTSERVLAQGVPTLPSLPPCPSVHPGLLGINIPNIPTGITVTPSLPGLPSIPSIPSIPNIPSVPGLPGGVPGLPGAGAVGGAVTGAIGGIRAAIPKVQIKFPANILAVLNNLTNSVQIPCELLTQKLSPAAVVRLNQHNEAQITAPETQKVVQEFQAESASRLQSAAAANPSGGGRPGGTGPAPSNPQGEFVPTQFHMGQSNLAELVADYVRWGILTTLKAINPFDGCIDWDLNLCIAVRIRLFSVRLSPVTNQRVPVSYIGDAEDSTFGCTFMPGVLGQALTKAEYIALSLGKGALTKTCRTLDALWMYSSPAQIVASGGRIPPNVGEMATHKESWDYMESCKFDSNFVDPNYTGPKKCVEAVHNNRPGLFNNKRRSGACVVTNEIATAALGASPLSPDVDLKSGGSVPQMTSLGWPGHPSFLLSHCPVISAAVSLRGRAKNRYRDMMKWYLVNSGSCVRASMWDVTRFAGVDDVQFEVAPGSLGLLGPVPRIEPDPCAHRLGGGPIFPFDFWNPVMTPMAELAISAFKVTETGCAQRMPFYTLRGLNIEKRSKKPDQDEVDMLYPLDRSDLPNECIPPEQYAQKWDKEYFQIDGSKSRKPPVFAHFTQVKAPTGFEADQVTFAIGPGCSGMTDAQDCRYGQIASISP